MRVCGLQPCMGSWPASPAVDRQRATPPCTPPAPPSSGVRAEAGAGAAAASRVGTVVIHHRCLRAGAPKLPASAHSTFPGPEASDTLLRPPGGYATPACFPFPLPSSRCFACATPPLHRIALLDAACAEGERDLCVACADFCFFYNCMCFCTLASLPHAFHVNWARAMRHSRLVCRAASCSGDSCSRRTSCTHTMSRSSCKASS